MTYSDFATSLARQAGEIIKKYFFEGVETEYKEHQSHVTIADRTINQLVADAIAKKFPKHGFIGEEGGGFNQNAEYIWVCDPLDGTLLFVAGIPNVAFSLSLVQDGQPILGTIYHPFSERLYSAEIGKGTRLNGKAVRVNTVNTLSRSLVGIFAWNKAHYDFTGVLTTLIKDTGADFQTGSAVYLGALVASGEAVANLFPHTTPWDVAAQKIIVEEAGGKT
ncbi:MAG: inositol monophosphatase family protein, partial [Parcubacteria group bacterium]